jgi:2-oxoglutarate/2-oxoacid ferredoxin oxidoreductase subunit beta
MKKIYQKAKLMTDAATHYCPGCGHGIIHNLIAEVIEELNIQKKTIAIAPVGCAVLAYDYWKLDTTEAAHGRPTAVATGIKRTRPDLIIFTYQGDGDLAAIGTAETIHAANRGENITVIFVNNGVYGMTGGQMAPTTLIGQKTTTSTKGRTAEREGYPLKISEMLAVLDGVCFIERTSIYSLKCVISTKRAIKKAFQNQIDKKGFSMVEVISPCPTYWGLAPHEAMKRIENEIIKQYPLGVLKDV